MEYNFVKISLEHSYLKFGVVQWMKAFYMYQKKSFLYVWTSYPCRALTAKDLHICTCHIWITGLMFDLLIFFYYDFSWLSLSIAMLQLALAALRRANEMHRVVDFERYELRLVHGILRIMINYYPATYFSRYLSLQIS